MQRRTWIVWAWVVGAALAGLWLARPAPLTAVDVEQPRLAEPAPIPGPDGSLAQTFTVQHNGLSAVEVRVVYYGPAEAAGGALILSVRGPDDRVVAQDIRQGLKHNDWVRLSFEPVANSGGQVFRLELTGVEPLQTSVWTYALDGYRGGELRQAQAALPGDLQFRTYYTYLWADMVRDSVGAAARLAGLLVPLWLVLFVPGLVVLDGLRLEMFQQSRWARWGGALALSLAVLPLAWLWTTTLGLAWSPVPLGAVYAALGAVVAGRWVLAEAREVLRRRVRVRASAFPASQPVPVRFVTTGKPAGFGRHDAAMALLLGTSVLLRLLATRDLALPPWVDSSHHALVARQMAETGRIPDNLQLVSDPASFTYHFGVHAVMVALDWFSPLDLSQTMLAAGQVLNGLMPLALYAGAAALTGRRRAALGAAFFVGIVSFFPGYYATWGRYSQLTGLLLLAPAMGAVWALLAGVDPRPAPAGVREPPVPWRLAAAAGVLSAGLLLAHYRVFCFYVAFVTVAALVHAWMPWRMVKRLGAAAAIGGLLAAPWVGRLVVAAVVPLVGEAGRLTVSENFNEFPFNYFAHALERGAFWLAGAATAWGLLRRDKAVWALALWVGGLFALLNFGPTTWLVNNNAWAISLFVPMAMVLGWGLDRWLTRARHWLAAAPTLSGPSPRWRQAARLGAGTLMVAAAAALAAFAGLQGSQRQLGIINPVTVLVRAEDVDALDWLKANTPSDAVFLVNGWKWFGDSWTGSDGGAWIMPYTGRRSTLPPVTYAFGPVALHEQVHDLATRVAAIEDAGSPETLALLQAEGVTHIFIGARGGHLKPEMFVDSEHYRLVYSNGAAWVFEVE